MESAELERTTVDIAAKAGGRNHRPARHRHGGEVRRLPHALHRGPGRQGGRRGRQPPAGDGDRRRAEEARDPGHPALHRAAAALFGSLAGQAHGRARHRPALDLRLDPAGAQGPRLRADRQEAARFPRTRAACSPRSWRTSSPATSNTISPPTSKSSSTRSPTTRCLGATCCATSGRDFTGAVGDIKELRITQVIDALDEMLAPHLFPPSKDGSDPRKCPNCANGRIGLKLGRFGGFVGCSNYPECKFTRQLTVGADGQGGGMRKLGEDPDTGLEVTVRGGRFGSYLQLGEADQGRRRRGREAQARQPAEGRLAGRGRRSSRRIKLLSLPREIGKSPEDGEPIIAGIGRFGSYVKHGKTYANLDAGEDVTHHRAQPRDHADRREARQPGQGPPVRRRSRQAARRASAEGRPGHRQERPLRALRRPTTASTPRCRATRRRRRSRSTRRSCCSTRAPSAPAAARRRGASARRARSRRKKAAPPKAPAKAKKRAAAAAPRPRRRASRRPKPPSERLANPLRNP